MEVSFSWANASAAQTSCLDWAIAYGAGICDNARPYLEHIHKREAYQRAR